MLGLRLWGRVIWHRRQFKRLKKALKVQEESSKREIKSLTKHYEQQLAVERVRNESINTEWANRFLQHNKLASLGISTTLLTEKAALKVIPEYQDTQNDETLTYNQNIELQERMDHFYSQGQELNRSPLEIRNRWEDIKEDVIADIRIAIQ